MKDRKKEFENLAEIIRSKSLQGAIDWIPSNYMNSYQSPLGNGVILITHNEEEEGSYVNVPVPEFSLAFINERGDTVYSIDAYCNSDSEYELLNEIYHSADDSYMKTDDTYKSMMDAIMKL